MVSLEQVKLLESKVTKTIDYVKKVTEENSRLKDRLESNQKRIDELEVLIHQFKEEQSRIEDGILSALDRLNKFEDAVETFVTSGTAVSRENKSGTEDKVAAETNPHPSDKSVAPAAAEKEKEVSVPEEKQDPSIGLEEDLKSGEELDIF